jgi:hypothetical protein
MMSKYVAGLWVNMRDFIFDGGAFMTPSRWRALMSARRKRIAPVYLHGCNHGDTGITELIVSPIPTLTGVFCGTEVVLSALGAIGADSPFFSPGGTGAGN